MACLHLPLLRLQPEKTMTDPIGFTLAATGSVDITVADASEPATTGLALTGVTTTVATSGGVSLTATATLTVSTSYWVLLKCF